MNAKKQWELLKFQSQNGLILTMSRPDTAVGWHIFQSQNGLILTWITQYFVVLSIHISIPKWSDFNLTYYIPIAP